MCSEVDGLVAADRWKCPFALCAATDLIRKEADMAVPESNTALSPYVTNFSAKLIAQPTVYGTTAQAATALGQLTLAYTTAQAALIAAREGGVRSEPLRLARDAARNAMLPPLRSFYGKIQKDITISDQAKADIGVHIPKTDRSRHGAPMVRPELIMTSVVDRLISISIENPTVGSKASRPKNATQTLVYFFAGENYPSDPTTWSFAGVATERRFSFTVPNSVPAGTRVWIAAAYTNARGDAGLVSVPISTSVQGNGSAVLTAELKLAA